MTNREKAIADLTKRLEALDDNERLAWAIYDNFRIVKGCKYCIYDDEENDKCRNTCHDSCQNGIKQWLEQEKS